MILERLDQTHLESADRDISKCEDKWAALPEFMTIDYLKYMLGREREFIMQVEPESDAKELEWGFFSGQLEKGKVVADAFHLYRVKTNLPKCPHCGASFLRAQGSLSRKDNKTMICSECGEAEAINEYRNELLKRRKEPV